MKIPDSRVSSHRRESARVICQFYAYCKQTFPAEILQRCNYKLIELRANCFFFLLLLQITGYFRKITSIRRVVIEFQENLIPAFAAPVSNSCSLVRSDLSLRDLQFYESGGVESVNEICTGHLKTSGFRRTALHSSGRGGGL